MSLAKHIVYFQPKFFIFLIVTYATQFTYFYMEKYLEHQIQDNRIHLEYKILHCLDFLYDSQRHPQEEKTCTNRCLSICTLPYT